MTLLGNGNHISEDQALVIRALKDAGADVLMVGTVNRVITTTHNGTSTDEWAIDGWDVQNITRERALTVIRDALNAR